MRMLVFAFVCLPFLYATSGCGPSKPDPRDRPDFVDTSDPGSVSLYSIDDFKKNGKGSKK